MNVVDNVTASTSKEHGTALFDDRGTLDVIDLDGYPKSRRPTPSSPPPQSSNWAETRRNDCSATCFCNAGTPLRPLSYSCFRSGVC